MLKHVSRFLSFKWERRNIDSPYPNIGTWSIIDRDVVQIWINKQTKHTRTHDAIAGPPKRIVWGHACTLSQDFSPCNWEKTLAQQLLGLGRRREETEALGAMVKKGELRNEMNLRHVIWTSWYCLHCYAVLAGRRSEWMEERAAAASSYYHVSACCVHVKTRAIIFTTRQCVHLCVFSGAEIASRVYVCIRRGTTLSPLASDVRRSWASLSRSAPCTGC